MIWAQIVHKFLELSLLRPTSSWPSRSLDHFDELIAFVFLVFIGRQWWGIIVITILFCLGIDHVEVNDNRLVGPTLPQQLGSLDHFHANRFCVYCLIRR